MENILKVNIAQLKHDSTLKERERRIENGQIEISKEKYLSMLKEMGLKIESKHSYYNDTNEIHHFSISISLIDKKHKLSIYNWQYPNVEPEKLETYQNIRKKYFVYDGKYLWDL